MAIMRLTTTLVRRLEADPGKDTQCRDSDVRGFAVIVAIAGQDQSGANGRRTILRSEQR